MHIRYARSVPKTKDKLPELLQTGAYRTCNRTPPSTGNNSVPILDGITFSIRNSPAV